MTVSISLLTAVDSTSHIHLIVGSNPLASARCAKSLEVGAKPRVIAPETAEIHYGLQKRIDTGEVEWLKKTFEDEDVLRLGREEVNGVVDAVFVTSGPRDPLSAHISKLCKRNRIPINVTDAPTLCTFTLLSTHTDGPLQIGVTTNGRGCKLSSRIRREIASSLPPSLGSACLRLGTIRRRIQEEDHLSHLALNGDLDDEDSTDQTASFNKLVTEADLDAAKNRRIRWLSQICEYWPLRRLSSITDSDVDSVLKSYATNPSTSTPLSPTSLDTRATSLNRGRIILAGSGPGHPDLLTRATHKAILAADLILADKLIPSGVLDLIPRRTPVHIARKFPGNAELAQEELLFLGLAGMQAGKTVLRLKQGDPYIYGRGGEEVKFFRKEGYGDRVSVLPGITSALSAPLFSGIPATQREVSDQVLICTGTGRKGKPTVPPEYVNTRTVVFLMALHRISGLVEDLTTYGFENATLTSTPTSSADGDDGNGPKDKEEDGMKVGRRKLWPLTTPCAVIERASCPDQRVIRTSLQFVSAAIEEEGSRPPGLLVLGKACEALCKADVGRKWVVEEGFKGLEDFGGLDGLVEQEVGTEVGERLEGCVKGDGFGKELKV
jgi:uroporphyrin-III C-methyltransferase